MLSRPALNDVVSPTPDSGSYEQLPPKKPPHSVRRDPNCSSTESSVNVPRRAEQASIDADAGKLNELIDGQLRKIAGMSRLELQRRWREVFPSAPHPKLSRSLLVSILSYRIQELAFGGLSPEVCARLRALRRQDSGRRGAASARAKHLQPDEVFSAPCARKRQPPTPVRLKPGTRLIREWHGETYTVMVLEQGYEFRGLTHKSLSQIARLITGTRWSGPLFFGLKQSGAGKDSAKNTETPKP